MTYHKLDWFILLANRASQNQRRNHGARKDNRDDSNGALHFEIP